MPTYDPDQPPKEPPIGADRLTWALAHQIHSDHGPDADGFCPTCGPLESWPCEPYQMAEEGFAGAFLGWVR